MQEIFTIALVAPVQNALKVTTVQGVPTQQRHALAVAGQAHLLLLHKISAKLVAKENTLPQGKAKHQRVFA